MAKTTKTVKPIRSLQKFNQGDTVNSLTLTGVTSLADVSIDKNGDAELKLNRDATKADKADLNQLVETVENLSTVVENLSKRLDTLEKE